MTEADWLAASEAGPMTSYLEVAHRILQFKAGRRRARLLACAWCRPLLAYLPGEWPGAIVALVERFADGLISKADLALARQVATENASRVTTEVWEAMRASAPGHSAPKSLMLAMWAATALQMLPLESSAAMFSNIVFPLWSASRHEPSLPNRCEAIREVFGNPFRPARPAPAWLRHNDGAARRLAATIYDTGAYAEAPVLADALEDAGCEDQAILGHLRGGGPHVRGCWVIDLMRGQR